MIQSASSWVPVIALNPKPNEKVLYMCSAPGGKSTHLSMLMGNTGELWCNDMNKDRIQSVRFNIGRMGVKNAIIISMDGRMLPK